MTVNYYDCKYINSAAIEVKAGQESCLSPVTFADHCEPLEPCSSLLQGCSSSEVKKKKQWIRPGVFLVGADETSVLENETNEVSDTKFA